MVWWDGSPYRRTRLRRGSVDRLINILIRIDGLHRRSCGSLPNRAFHPRSRRLHRIATPTPAAIWPRDTSPNTHHNGLPKLLFRAYLRQANRCACSTHIRNRARRFNAFNPNSDPDRATREPSFTAHHKIEDQTPPFEPQRPPSSALSQQHHPPARCAIRPPRSRRPGMANLQLQLQQSSRQDAPYCRQHC